MDGKSTEDRHAVESRITSTESRISRENAASELRLQARVLESEARVLDALKDVQITISNTSADRYTCGLWETFIVWVGEPRACLPRVMEAPRCLAVHA